MPTLTAVGEMVLAAGAITQTDIDFLSSAGAFGADDVIVDAFDNEGRNLGSRSLAEVLIRRIITDRWGKCRRICYYHQAQKSRQVASQVS